MESELPRRGDPNLIYFGLGIDEVSSLVVTNNQTVYVAAGAVVRGVIGPAEKFHVSSYSGLRTYAPTFLLTGTNISFRGRGIVDGGLCPTHARNLLSVQGKEIRLEGVILRDSSTWTIPIRQSERVQIKNVKLVGYRANSDGIDICNSQDVMVEDCFIRTRWRVRSYCGRLLARVVRRRHQLSETRRLGQLHATNWLRSAKTLF